MDTDSIYLAVSEENVEDVILSKRRNEWNAMRSSDCRHFHCQRTRQRLNHNVLQDVQETRYEGTRAF